MFRFFRCCRNNSTIVEFMVVFLLLLVLCSALHDCSRSAINYYVQSQDDVQAENDL